MQIINLISKSTKYKKLRGKIHSAKTLSETLDSNSKTLVLRIFLTPQTLNLNHNPKP
jgi:hypothetical protein